MKHPNMSRFKAAFALDRLSARVQSDVLADGSLAARFSFELKHPVRLAEDLVFPREELFAAFRVAADNGEAHLLAKDNAAGRVTISGDHAATVEFGDRRWRFENAALLASSTTQREQVLEILLSRHSLSPRIIEELRSIVRKHDFSDDDFFQAVTLLTSSPESFTDRLLSRVDVRQVGKADLLPEDDRHWDHLTGPVLSSRNLTEYLANELDEVRRSRFAADPQRAFDLASLGYAAALLVPLDIARRIETGVLHTMIEQGLEHDDHFALIGLFEICADALVRDARFERLGERVLERLCGDMERLKSSCGMFAAGFVLATAHLSEHEMLRSRPVFWRRLAAASHASLIVRTCGVTPIKQDELVSWALWLSGTAYFASVLADMHAEPRWRPEWLFPNFLIADCFGRARNAVALLGKDRTPESWTTRLDAAHAWIDEQKIGPASTFPAVLEGAPRPPQANLAQSGLLTEAYESFFSDLTLDHFLFMAHIVYSFGTPPEMTPRIRKILEIIRADSRDIANPPLDSAVALAANIAVQLQDAELANDVADLCVEKSATNADRAAVYECVFRLLECSQADTDTERSKTSLARWLESLAFRIPVEVGLDLAEAIAILTRVQPELTSLLSRAAAAARLGAARLPTA